MNQEITAKMAKYCAFQERCTHDILVKLENFDIPEAEKEAVIGWLSENNFVDDKRFAITFAESKFHAKKWGRMKIRFQLENKELPEQIIDDALNAIPEIEYLHLFKSLLKEKQRTTTGSNEYNKNHKIARSLIARGFEPDLIWQYLRV